MITLDKASDFNNGTVISEYMTSNSITSLTIGGTIKTIPFTGGYEPFQVAKTITIDSSVVSIQDHAFQFSVNLEKVILNGVINTIPKFAFSHCEKLTSFDFDKISTIEFAAFEHCYSLVTIAL